MTFQSIFDISVVSLRGLRLVNDVSNITSLYQCCHSVPITGEVLSPRMIGGETAMGKPNIVFILIDDLGWRDVTCYGSTFYETPHIDRLAREGMLFTNGYASCPVCSPT